MAEYQPAAHRWAEMAADSPMELIERRRVIGRLAMISHVTLKKGLKVPTHRHENEQFACVLSGRIRFALGAVGSPEHRQVTLEGGAVLYLPSNTPHAAEALEETVVLDIFSPPSETTGIDRAS